MKDFAAIDFETANGKRTSVCSVGIVIVKGGKIVNKIYRLIRPAPNYYTQWTTAIHGLTCRTSRKVFGKDLPNHQLHTVAERCGYNLENHHHALADAEACAQIALLIIPEPKKAKPAKKANKDTHVGDLFDSLIPQTVTVKKTK